MSKEYWMIELPKAVACWLYLKDGNLVWTNDPHRALKFSTEESAKMVRVFLLKTHKTKAGLDAAIVTDHIDVTLPGERQAELDSVGASLEFRIPVYDIRYTGDNFKQFKEFAEKHCPKETKMKVRKQKDCVLVEYRKADRSYWDNIQVNTKDYLLFREDEFTNFEANDFNEVFCVEEN